MTIVGTYKYKEDKNAKEKDGAPPKLQRKMSKRNFKTKASSLNHTFTICSFEEIGWMHPDMFHTKRPRYCLASATFDKLAYHPSRHKPRAPPNMVYLPSAEIFLQILHTCMLGLDSEHVQTEEELMSYFVKRD